MFETKRARNSPQFSSRRLVPPGTRAGIRCDTSVRGPIRRPLLALLAAVVVWTGAAGQAKTPTAKKPPPAIAAAGETAAIRLSIVPLASSGTLRGSPASPQLDLGRVSYGGHASTPGVGLKRTRDALVLSTRFGLLLQAAGGRSLGNATVRAFVTAGGSKKTYAIDGIKLTTTPQIISTAAPIGIVAAHRLEITVPTSEAPGPVTGDVGFLVTPN